MIAYLRCLCGRNKPLSQKLSSEGYDVRVISHKLAWRKEAKTYNAQLPFSVKDGIVTQL